MSEEKAPIEAPKTNRKADFSRAAMKGALGAVPVAGSLAAEAADLLMPDPSGKDRQRWEGEITGGVNSLHGRVDKLDDRTGDRSITLSGASALAAKFMAESCPDGMGRKYVTLDEVTAAYPDLDRKSLKVALGDLESYGLVQSLSAINAGDRYRMTQAGYLALDAAVMGWNPQDDARTIAGLAARDDKGVRVADLDAELGWSRRRFNPALKIVVAMIGQGRISQSSQPDYVTWYFSPNNAERAALRRYAAGE